MSESDVTSQMMLDYAAFDGRDGPTAWRSLNARGYTDAAVALLKSYRLANAGRLSADQRDEIAFHIGQTFAFAGRDVAALPFFEQADGPEATAEWHAYVAATVAFLRRDRAALAAARTAYAAAPGADAMRRSVIDGFVACPDKSYVESAHCAMH